MAEKITLRFDVLAVVSDLLTEPHAFDHKSLHSLQDKVFHNIVWADLRSSEFGSSRRPATTRAGHEFSLVPRHYFMSRSGDRIQRVSSLLQGCHYLTFCTAGSNKPISRLSKS